MLKISKDSTDGIFSSASYHGFNLMGYNPLYGKYLSLVPVINWLVALRHKFSFKNFHRKKYIYKDKSKF